MKIHPLWYFCIFVRISIIFLIRYLKNLDKFKRLVPIILLIIGSGLVYNGLTGSNNEIQLSKVFWHETRYVHGTLYLLASYYLYNNNLDMNSLVLFTDVIFSFVYRLYTNQ